MDQKAYWFLGNLVIVHASGEETDGRFTVLEFLTPPGDMTPLHSHERAGQITFGLEGEVTVYLSEGAHVLRSGDLIQHPAGVIKTQKVTSSEPARYLDINFPSGFEGFVAAVGTPADSLTLPPPPDEEPDPERLARIAEEHHIKILGPPGELP
jgi:quercetin dioxygenase-like cupin family protein